MIQITNDDAFDLQEVINDIADNFVDLQIMVNKVVENQNKLKKESILSVEHFKSELKRCRLFTKELDEFIDNYMRFDNKKE